MGCLQPCTKDAEETGHGECAGARQPLFGGGNFFSSFVSYLNFLQEVIVLI